MKYFKAHLIGYSFMLFSVQVARAQRCDLTLKGTITDKLNNEGLSFAQVKLQNSNKVAQANENGDFVFENLCVGRYKILIQHIGCKDTLLTVDLEFSKRLSIKLDHRENILEGVIISHKRLDIQKTQIVDAVSAEEIQSTKGQNLGDILKNITGLTTLNTGASISKPMIHGLQGYRLLTLNNGVRQEGQQWGNEHAPEIDPFTAKKISVIKGVNALRYGSDAIAGVILIEPGDLPDTAAVTGELNLAGFSNGRTGAASAFIEGSFEKMKNFSWRVQGTLKKGGNIRSPDYFLSNTGSEEKNFSSAFSYHRKNWGIEAYYSQFNSTIGIFNGSQVGNLTDLNDALLRQKPLNDTAVFSYNVDRPKQVVAHELIKTKWHCHIGQKWHSSVQYSWQFNNRQEYDLRRLTSAETQSGKVAPDLDLKLNSHVVEGMVEHDYLNHFRGQAGANFIQQQNVYDGRFFIPNYINHAWGVFAHERYVKPGFEVEIGARYDEKYLQSFFYKANNWTNVKRRFNNATYNMGAIWKPDTMFHLFFNAGTAWRAPAPNELYSNGIHQGVASIEKGDAFLKTETCFNVSTSGILKTKKLKAELTAYFNQFTNFIYLNPTNDLQLTIRGAFPVFNYSQARVRINGLDVKAEYSFSKSVTVITKGMLVRAWNYQINDYLIYMPGDRADLQFKIKIPSSTIFSNVYFQINQTAVAKQWRVPANTDFAPPPAAYYLLGFDIATQVNLKKQKLFLNFNATNLLNATYRDYLDRFRYYNDAAGVSYNLKLTVPITFYHKHN
jgi:iron complex outermembrane recepter protein